jgi:hypothetical protein
MGMIIFRHKISSVFAELFSQAAFNESPLSIIQVYSFAMFFKKVAPALFLDRLWLRRMVAGTALLRHKPFRRIGNKPDACASGFQSNQSRENSRKDDTVHVGYQILMPKSDLI